MAGTVGPLPRKPSLHMHEYVRTKTLSSQTDAAQLTPPTLDSKTCVELTWPCCGQEDQGVCANG